jgi:hypothetical protein
MRVCIAFGAGMLLGLLAAMPLAAQAGEPAASDLSLNFDVSPSPDAPAPSLHVPRLAQPDGLNVSRAENADGSSLVAVKRALPGEWNARVGVDLGMAAPQRVSFEPGLPPPGGTVGAPSRAAWASMGVVPGLATLDARIDPGIDQGRVGTTFRHAVDVGSRFSVTLHDSYGITGSFGNMTPAMPLPAAPTWNNESGVALGILPTGTTLSATLASASTDPLTHHSLSADQRIYGPLHVTTAVTDPGEPTASKSITAGLKLNW